MLGISMDVLREQFGEPDDVGGTYTEYRKPSIWKYGDVEFYLDPSREVLASILIHDFDVPSGGVHLHLDPWILRGGLPLDVLTNALDEEQISYCLVPASRHNPSLYVKTCPNLSLIFVSKDEQLPFWMREPRGPWTFFGVMDTKVI
jgi:hypothetical protein